MGHFAKASSGGEVKRMAFAFVGRVVLVSYCSRLELTWETEAKGLTSARAQMQTDPSYTNRFTIADDPTPASAMGQWVLSLPKYLWELGTKHAETTEVSPRLRVLPSFAATDLEAIRTLDVRTPTLAGGPHLAPPPRATRAQIPLLHRTLLLPSFLPSSPCPR